MIYRGWEITFSPKPILSCADDYDVLHPDYDGGDGGNGLYMTAGSIAEAREMIDDYMTEAAND